MLGDSIDINNLYCNPAVLKKIGKASKNLQMGHTQKFLAERTKADHQLSETFYFIKISLPCVLAELRIFFYFV